MKIAAPAALAAALLLGACGTPATPEPTPSAQTAPQAPQDDLLGLEEAMALPEATDLAVAACGSLDAGFTYAEVRAQVEPAIDWSATDFDVDDMLAVMLLAGCPEYL